MCIQIDLIWKTAAADEHSLEQVLAPLGKLPPTYDGKVTSTDLEQIIQSIENEDHPCAITSWHTCHDRQYQLFPELGEEIQIHKQPCKLISANRHKQELAKKSNNTHKWVVEELSNYLMMLMMRTAIQRAILMSELSFEVTRSTDLIMLEYYFLSQQFILVYLLYMRDEIVNL